jgi:hypothetical protein
MSQYRPALGYMGVDSKRKVVPPLSKGPYTVYRKVKSKEKKKAK